MPYDISQFQPRTGQEIRNDGTITNLADLANTSGGKAAGDVTISNG